MEFPHKKKDGGEENHALAVDCSALVKISISRFIHMRHPLSPLSEVPRNFSQGASFS
jgi:hypothetical protein